MRIKYILSIFAAFSMFVSTSCDTELDINPSNQISDDKAYATLDACESALAGVYDGFTAGWFAHYTNQYMFYLPDIMADDSYVASTGNYNRFVSSYQFSVDPTSTYTKDPWANTYSIIDNANALIAGLDKFEDSDRKKSILGQAKAIRAYCYHFLVRMYGKPYSIDPNAPGVVLRTVSSIDPTPRSTVKDVYTLMVEDLTWAANNLKENTATKYYIDQRAAEAILARVYLDMGDPKAIDYAEKAANGITLLSTDQYATENFSKVNSETLWAFVATSDDYQGYLSLPSFWYFADGGYYDENGDLEYKNMLDGYSSFRVSESLIDIFDDADVRKKLFPTVDGHPDEYLRFRDGIVTSKIRHVGMSLGIGAVNYLRASEMYLIVAEVAADQGNYTKAKQALNTVRKARGLADYAGADATLADEIQNERRRELFAEGHRFFDIKRRKGILSRYTTYDAANPSKNLKEGHWHGVYLNAGDNKMVLPIPQDELTANSALTKADQNPGY